MSFDAVYLATKIPDLQSAPPQPTEFVDSFLGVFEEDLMSGSLDDLVTHWEMGNLTVFVEVSRRLNQAVFHQNYFNFDDGIDAMIELETEVTDLLKKRLEKLT